MANIPIWPGSSSFHPGDTPFGFYDYDSDFQKDADKVANFCALRLGYPIENVELQDINFYAAFEEAVTVYANELFAYKQREEFLTLEGTPYSYEKTNVDLQDAIITPNLQRIVDLSEQYGTWAGVGGNVDWYSGSVVLTSSIQDYDLDAWATSQGLTGSDVEIMRIFYQGPPAVSEMYTPYAAGFGFDGDAAAFAFMGGGYGFGDNFLMMPLSYDIQTIQAIEMSDQVRLSNYTFQLINNKLRIFPVPGRDDDGCNLWFEYMLKSDEACASVDVDPNAISNISQVPFRNVDYNSINSVGRAWIFEYTLALVKEILGYVRGKYTQVPIPGAEITLNQADLLSSAEADKNKLIDRLREYFESTSRQSLLERRQAESVARNSELGEVPMTIFIG
tara:strand:- start:2271 stop:3443 length:1173 start_codon:yes stop_codon:yes gene_type:complete